MPVLRSLRKWGQQYTPPPGAFDRRKLTVLATFGDRYGRRMSPKHLRRARRARGGADSPYAASRCRRSSEGRGALVLRVHGLRKRFGSLHVLRDITLDLHAGEILALVGENGAGKSTLVRCIAGSRKPDAGRVDLFVDTTGRPTRTNTIEQHDIAVVWQDLALCDNLSTVANLFLGNEHVRRRMLDESTIG